MMSVEGELVPFKTRIKPSEANGAVEKWLVQVRKIIVIILSSPDMLKGARSKCQCVLSLSCKG
jgi:hypothetical protein